MTVMDFSKILGYSEPDFGYHGTWYTICWAGNTFPNVDFSISAFDGTEDQFPTFHGLDDLLDNCIIEGKSLREILPEIEM